MHYFLRRIDTCAEQPSMLPFISYILPVALAPLASTQTHFSEDLHTPIAEGRAVGGGKGSKEPSITPPLLPYTSQACRECFSESRAVSSFKTQETLYRSLFLIRFQTSRYLSASLHTTTD